MRSIIVIFTLIFVPLIGNAQFVGRYIGIGPIMASYRGDLSGYEKFSSGFQLSLIPVNQNKLRSSFSFSRGVVVANASKNFYSKYKYVPKSFVRTKFMALHYTLNYFFINKEKFSAYAGIGFGALQFKPEDEFGNELYSVSNDSRPEGENYNLTKIMLPINAGIIYKMKNNVALHFDFKFLNSRTDYLDNISQLANTNDMDNIISILFGVLIPLKNPK